MTPEMTSDELPNGPVAAALIAGGLGCGTIALMTLLAEAFPSVADALNWWKPAGPLTGKTLIGAIVFLAAWLVLHLIFRGRNVAFGRAATIALALLGLGLLGTFPPFFALFSAE